MAPRSARSFWTVVCLLATFLVAGCGQQGDATGAAGAPAGSTEAAASASPAGSPSGAASADTASALAEGSSSTAASPSVAASPSAAAASASAVAVATPGAGEFQNPVIKNNFADPFVLKDGDTYYAYATESPGINVQVARSTDLVDWEILRDAMPVLAPWVKPNRTWAPEVMKIGDKYVLYYTAWDRESNRQCLGLATSDKPEGKFTDVLGKAFVCQADQGGTIDAHAFRDEDGKLYLYYKNDGNCCAKPTYLYAQELAPDGLSLVGEPVQLVKNDKAWEGPLIEAPTMWKHEGTYYLFFSANKYETPAYAVGYATCDSPMGPCEDSPDNPFLESVLKKPPVLGPGHQTIITDDDGETWLVYHAWEVASTGVRTNRRFVWMDELEWKDGKPVLRGPTVEPQPLP